MTRKVLLTTILVCLLGSAATQHGFHDDPVGPFADPQSQTLRHRGALGVNQHAL